MIFTIGEGINRREKVNAAAFGTPIFTRGENTISKRDYRRESL